jgi:hypothetical protein
MLLPGQGRRFVAQNVDLRTVVHYAYALQSCQDVEGDAPLLDQRFHVTAVAAEAVTPTPRGQPGPFKSMTRCSKSASASSCGRNATGPSPPLCLRSLTGASSALAFARQPWTAMRWRQRFAPSTPGLRS